MVEMSSSWPHASTVSRGLTVVGMAAIAMHNTSDDDDSSSDDDYYQNIARNLNNTASSSNVPEVFRRREPPQQANSSNRGRQRLMLPEDESDDDSMEITDDLDPLERMRRLAKKSLLEEQLKRKKELENIERQARVEDAEPGARPQKYVCNPALEQAENNLRQMNQMNTDLLDTVPSPVRRTSLDFSKYEENDEDVFDIMVKDLEDPSAPMDNRVWLKNQPLRELAEVIAAKWSCSVNSVKLSINDKAVLLTDTPESLKFKRKRMTFVSAFRIKEASVAANVTIVDPNILSIKCQQANKRAVIVEIHKDTTFDQIRNIIKDKMKLDTISRLLFDGEEVLDDRSPAELDMETDDCLDVYA